MTQKRRLTPKRQRRQEQERIYKEVTIPFVRDRANGLCQECTAQGCECHHIYGRDGERLNDTDHIIYLCWACHQYAQANLKETRPKHLEILRREKDQ